MAILGLYHRQMTRVPRLAGRLAGKNAGKTPAWRAASPIRDVP
jgi:hypothetical protein